MIPPVDDDLLFDAVQTDRMVEAGRAYHRQGRVSELEIDRELSMVSAVVRGSGRNHYVTSVIFEDEELGGFPDSQCSCPVGEGCKHVAAVLFALREARPASGAAASRSRLTIRMNGDAAPALSAPLAQWLDAATLDALTAAIPRDALCFTLEPARAFKQIKAVKKSTPAPEKMPDRFLPHVRAWRLRGGESAWRPAHSWELQHGSAGLVDPLALRLLGRMAMQAAGGDFGPGPAPSGRYGWQWLCEAAAAGLLRWKKPDGAPVTIGQDNIAARLSWRLFADGRQIVDLEGPDPALTVFAGDPPLAYDAARGELTLIDTGVTPVLAGRLLAMPPVGPAEVSALAGRWIEVAGDALPPPRLALAEDIASSPPRPVLRFLIDKVQRPTFARNWRRQSWAQATELARVEFDYGGHRIGAGTQTREIIVRGPAGLGRVVRDAGAEQAAIDRLARTALLPIALQHGFDPKPRQAWDHALLDPGTGIGDDHTGGFAEFLINEIETLEAEGWIVEYARDWRYGYLPLEEEAQLALVPDEAGQGKGPAKAGQAGGIDWFDVELAALVDGRRLDILPALRRLLAESGSRILERDDDYRVPVMLDGGRFTAVRLGSVRPLVEALLRLALADRGASPLKVSRYDLGTLHELAGGGLAWTGEDSLRALAAALHGPDGSAYVAPGGLRATLRPYQQAGAAWLRALHGAALGGILADDMGLGKTLQAIAHVLHVRDQAADAKVLIVAPTSVLPNWQAELARFAPDLECQLWHGSRRHEDAGALDRAGLVLTSYPLLARDQELLAGRDHALVVLDEAHVLKNPRTAGFKAAAALKAGQVVALSGTPVENRLNDVWALASLANPGLLGTFGRSARRTARRSRSTATVPRAPRWAGACGRSCCAGPRTKSPPTCRPRR